MFGGLYCCDVAENPFFKISLFPVIHLYITLWFPFLSLLLQLENSALSGWENGGTSTILLGGCLRLKISLSKAWSVSPYWLFRKCSRRISSRKYGLLIVVLSHFVVVSFLLLVLFVLCFVNVVSGDLREGCFIRILIYAFDFGKASWINLFGQYINNCQLIMTLVLRNASFLIRFNSYLI